MAWRDYRIANKIRIGYFLLTSIFCVAVAFIVHEIGDIQDSATRTTTKNAVSATLLLREIDHLKWAQTVSAYVFDAKAMRLDVATDPTKCKFGQWFYSEERKRLEDIIPGIASPLQAIEAPHSSLHASAETIQALRGQAKADEAAATYNGQTLLHLAEVQRLLGQMRDMVGQEVAREQSSLLGNVGHARGWSLGAGGLSLLLALVLGVVISRSIARPLAHLESCSSEIAGGNLDVTCAMPRGDEVGRLSQTVESMVQGLKEKIAEADRKSREADDHAASAEAAVAESQAKEQRIAAMLETITAISHEAHGIAQRLGQDADALAAQTHQVRQGAETQKSRLTEAATAMEQMNATVLEVARNATAAASSAAQAQAMAEEGADVVGQSVASIRKINELSDHLSQNMSELGRQADSIGQVMNVISDIADQTNLLALNAAIEAARAGDAGRGFAVVADEVRKLAEKTMLATREVGDKIGRIQQSVQLSVADVQAATREIQQADSLAEKSGESLQEILDLAQVNTANVQGISAAAEEQSAASQHINHGLAEVSVVARQTESGMRETEQVIQRLSRLAHQLNDVMSRMNAA